VIRRAVPGEAAAIQALVRQAYAPWVAIVGREPRPMQDDYAARIAAGQAWVLDEDGLAAVTILENAPDHLMIENVAVAPGRQGRGLGRRMIAHAATLARAAGCSELRLYTNALMRDNIALYEHLGFHETHRDASSNFNRVYMSLDFTASVTL